MVSLPALAILDTYTKVCTSTARSTDIEIEEALDLEFTAYRSSLSLITLVYELVPILRGFAAIEKLI
mgnify:CR=1 FL=1